MGRGKGFLRLTVQRVPPAAGDSGRYVNLVVSSEVANFYPTIRGWGWFSAIGRYLYRYTQLAAHVVITNAFLRSLARLDFEPSVVGALRDAGAAAAEEATAAIRPGGR
jgi:hypothetical protein